MNCLKALSGQHSFYRDVCIQCGEPNPFFGKLVIDKETAKELIQYLEHEYVPATFTKVWKLMKQLHEFTGA